MALQKTVTTPQGFEAYDAYHRVEGVTLTTKETLAFNVRSYKQESGVPHFGDESFSCDYDIDGDNPIAQAYSYLKTLPEFSSAVDC